MKALLIFTLTLIPYTSGTSYLNTQLGSLNGTVEPASYDNSVLTFKGIPFGKAPIGERRFKHSEPYGSWEGVRDASKFSHACEQQAGWGMGTVEEIQSEDCLFLNVYIPGDHVDLSRQPKPVMVWIYGGGWYLGAAQQYDLRNLAATGDVIVVSFNYRVGLYGFMTSGDDAIPGNMGIGDQILALQWVKDNIAEYGGDPDTVTIFGESAGSWSVSVLAVSPMARSLFQRAIGQSGTIMYTNHRSDMIGQAHNIVKELGCVNYLTSDDILTCMREASVDSINAMFMTYLNMVYVDDYVLPQEPKAIWESGLQNKVPYMIGATSGDGASSIDFIDPTRDYLNTGLTEEQVRQMLFLTLSFVTYDDNCEDSESILKAHYYGGHYMDKKMNLEGTIDMMTDGIYITPGVELSNHAMEAGQDVYWYYFNQPPHPYSPAGQAIIEVGAEHGDDLAFVFGWFFEGGPLDYLADEARIKLSFSMINAWTSFARTGTPVWLANDYSEQTWPKYTMEEALYVEFRDNLDPEANIQEHLMEARAKVWLQNLPQCELIEISGVAKFGAYQGVLLFALVMVHISRS